MKELIAFIPVTLLATLAWGQIPAADDAKEPRDLGHTVPKPSPRVALAI